MRSCTLEVVEMQLGGRCWHTVVDAVYAWSEEKLSGACTALEVVRDGGSE